MKVSEFLDKIEVQSEIAIVKFDEDKLERVDILREEALEKEIKFIYCENDILYIEIEE